MLIVISGSIWNPSLLLLLNALSIPPFERQSNKIKWDGHFPFNSAFFLSSSVNYFHYKFPLFWSMLEIRALTSFFYKYFMIFPDLLQTNASFVTGFFFPPT